MDVVIRRGDYSAGQDPPFIAGADSAGVIESVGPGVSEFKVKSEARFMMTCKISR